MMDKPVLQRCGNDNQDITTNAGETASVVAGNSVVQHYRLVG